MWNGKETSTKIRIDANLCGYRESSRRNVSQHASALWSMVHVDPKLWLAES